MPIKSPETEFLPTRVARQGWADKRKCLRMLAITGGSSTAAIIFKLPPHLRQHSILNTRPSKRAKFMRAMTVSPAIIAALLLSSTLAADPVPEPHSAIALAAWQTWQFVEIRQIKSAGSAST
jgi:hypothetical protein